MKKARYTESQIFKILKEAESGIPVPELCRRHGMSDASFCKWRAKYGGMDISNMTRLRELEEENRRLEGLAKVHKDRGPYLANSPTCE
jgi:putative transposase